MKNNKLTKIQIKTLIFLSIILLTGVYTLFPYDFYKNSNLNDVKEETEDLNLFNNPLDTIEKPKSSVLGNETWWNTAYQYRKIIKVTNPYPIGFVDYCTNFSFYYSDLVSEDKMQSDLDDIRIVEKGIQRKYYFKKDYPSVNYVTVWFDTNISSSTTEYDAYLYFGNSGAVDGRASSTSERFGWIKNGDFELDFSSSSKFNPFGWTFTHDPVDTIKGVSNPSPNAYNSSSTSYELFVNKIIDVAQGAERIAQGKYAYKWGALNPTLPDGSVNDYAGTFFSYPFKVPKIIGGQISLKLYRNIRTYRFERPKNMGAINVDGYFIRVLNASDYNLDPDTHLDTHISSTYKNYIESYDGYAYYNPSSKKWDNPTVLIDFPGHTSQKDTLSEVSSDGQLTGYTIFNLTAYMGKEIFFEIGVWGNEDNSLRKEKSGFFQVDDLKFNYTLIASLEELQADKSTVNVIVKDVDGRLVPNAEVFLINDSAKGTSKFVYDSLVATEGKAIFSNVPNGRYNITVNYTISSIEIEVFNSSKSKTGPYYFNGISYTREIQANIWTIDFEIVDWDGIPLSIGYIEVKESPTDNSIQNVTLDENGKATFRGLNDTSYYYRVIYDNDDYADNFIPKILNESYILRSEYDKSNVKYRTQTINVNDVNKALPAQQKYYVREHFYTNGSRTEFGNKKIIAANITLTNLNDKITNISIYYIDQYNLTGSGDQNLIYFEDGYAPGVEDDFINLDIMTIDNDKLKSEGYYANGLLVIVYGENYTKCGGTIDVETIETCNVYNITALARLNIRLITRSLGGETPLSGLVKIVDHSTGTSLVNLTAQSSRNGYAYGEIHDVPFWYLIGNVYNFTFDVAGISGNAPFNVTYFNPNNPWQWYPTQNSNGIKEYNLTLYHNASITFNIIPEVFVNFTEFSTTFLDYYGITQVVWGNNMLFWVNFTYTDDGGITWSPITGSGAYCTLKIKLAGSDVILFSERLFIIGNGNFSITLNASRLLVPAGKNYEYYNFEIHGSHPIYDNPEKVTFLVKVSAVPTGLGVYDYTTRLIIADKVYSEHFGIPINITFRYYKLDGSQPLINAILSYVWLTYSPARINIDPLFNGFYTIDIDTSITESTGLYPIIINASLNNHSTQISVISLKIEERITTLNGKTGLVYISKHVWVMDAYNFTYYYNDYLTTDPIGDLNVYSYSWQEIGSGGEPIPGREGYESLIEVNNTYMLDFDTETQKIGTYLLQVTLKKDNYEIKISTINLVILIRQFDYEIDATNLKDDQINVVKGKKIKFEIDIIDTSRNIPLTGATVVLEINDKEYEFDEESAGYYTLTLETEDVEAYFSSKTLPGTITIKKEDFETQEYDVTVVVEMEEIFPGIPAFYFWLVLAAISGVIGSLIGYKTVQQARIPIFIKKVKKVSKSIKANKSIPLISIPTKEEMFLEDYEKDWREIGLDLNDVLRVRETKSGMLSKAKDLITKRGDNE